MKRPRDSQRKKLYAAEHVLGSKHESSPDLTEIAQCQRYVDLVQARAWFARRWPHQPRIIVNHNGSSGSSRAHGSRLIRMSVYHRNRPMLLHEMAHCIHCWHGGRYQASHGPEYAAIYLTLVRYALGEVAAGLLTASFRANRVRFRPKKKRILSPEQKAALVARLNKPLIGIVTRPSVLIETVQKIPAWIPSPAFAAARARAEETSYE